MYSATHSDVTLMAVHYEMSAISGLPTVSGAMARGGNAVTVQLNWEVDSKLYRLTAKYSYTPGCTKGSAGAWALVSSYESVERARDRGQ